MFRTISHFRSCLTPKFFINPNRLIHTPVNPSPCTETCSFRSLSTSIVLQKQHQDENNNADLKSPPRLFVVQPRVRPDSVLKTKLEEALNLANSLEEQREGGFYDTEFIDKQLPPHLVVQNPAARSTRAGEAASSHMSVPKPS